MTIPLHARACTACGRNAPRLAAAEIAELIAQLPDWTLLDDATRIERRHRFRDFAEAFAFVTRIAALAEAAGHHPDVRFGWGYADVSLQTHSIGGLHQNDFILAARFDRVSV